MSATLVFAERRAVQVRRRRAGAGWVSVCVWGRGEAAAATAATCGSDFPLPVNRRTQAVDPSRRSESSIRVIDPSRRSESSIRVFDPNRRSESSIQVVDPSR